MKIIWTEKAGQQLDQIFNYIAADSALYAHRTVEQIIERAESTSRHPRKGRMVPEYQRKDIREVFHHPYRIIYRVKDQDEEINILSVIHEARLLPDESE